MGVVQSGVSEKQNGRGWPLISLAAMLWATDLILRPQAQKAGLSAVQIVLFEHLALAAIFVPALLKSRDQWRAMPSKIWASLFFIAIFGSALGTILLTEAYRLGSPLLTALLQKTQPVFAIVFAGILLKERRRPIFWPLFGGALAATYLLAFGTTAPSLAIQSSQALPVCLALGASAIWGTCTVIGRIATHMLSPSIVAGWRFMLALPFLLATAIFFQPPHQTTGFSWSALTPLVLIVLLPDALGMTLYYRGLKRTPASLATLAELAFPATALIIGLVAGHESLNLWQWIGLGCLLLCLHIIQRTKSVEDAPAESQTPSLATT